MQAPTSDRETASLLMTPDFYKLTLKFAEDEIARGSKDRIMPKDLVPSIFDSPVSVHRWHSLIAKGVDDDFFSSDIEESVLKRMRWSLLLWTSKRCFKDGFERLRPT
ncbi:uncharacterized protein EKO05_0005399 [Ascochyta rabiei]|uniref:uncharacterized protein n=1 Tax=Didymella rabiei TaxID=5454 RepID=UPI0021FF86EA|nr:uncharacterized protein EKO05_0005399 [Ascochyta rabiei]UPX14928.1 hypothetical protein EKO05_0005399 [Ascochyta rabiei]